LLFRQDKSGNIIKIGVILNSKTAPAWTYKILSEIKKDSNLELRLFIVNGEKKY